MDTHSLTLSHPDNYRVPLSPDPRVIWIYIQTDVSCKASSVTVDVFSPAGHHYAARGGELPASVPQRNTAGQQRGVHEGEGQRSTYDTGLTYM